MHKTVTILNEREQEIDELLKQQEIRYKKLKNHSQTELDK